MALARLALNNLQQKWSSASSTLLGHNLGEIKGVSGTLQKQIWSDEALKRSMVTSTDKFSDEKRESKEVDVSEGGKKSKLFPRRRNRRSLWDWRRDERDIPPLYEFFPSGLGDALLQASQNINRLFENMKLGPYYQLMARVKEEDKCYKLRYDVPGLSKEDVKITVDNGVLTIKGEHKEQDEEGSDDEYCSARSYGYYNTSLVLPEDAKADDINAELKDGVLSITIPRTEMPKKDVKEVNIA